MSKSGHQTRGTRSWRQRVGLLASMTAVMSCVAISPFVAGPSPVSAAAGDSPAGGCGRVWVGPATGAADFGTATSWNPPLVPGTDDSVCFGVEHGGTAVNLLELTSSFGRNITEITVSPTSTVILRMDLTVSDLTYISGVYVAPGFSLQTQGIVQAGREAGALANPEPSPTDVSTLVGNTTITVEAGATLLANGLRVEGRLVNLGRIVGSAADDHSGSLDLASGSYSGSGELDIAAFDVVEFSDYNPPADTAHQIGRFSIDNTSSGVILAHSEFGELVVDGILEIYKSITAQNVSLGGQLFVPSDAAGFVVPDTFNVTTMTGFLNSAADLQINHLFIHEDAHLEKAGAGDLVITDRASLGRGIKLNGGDLSLNGETLVSALESQRPSSGAFIDIFNGGLDEVRRPTGLAGAGSSVSRRPVPASSSLPGPNVTINGCLAVTNELLNPRSLNTSLELVRYDASTTEVDIDVVIKENNEISGALWQIANEPATFPALVLLERNEGTPNTTCPSAVDTLTIGADGVEITEGQDGTMVSFSVNNPTGEIALLTSSLRGTGDQPIETDDLFASRIDFTAPPGLSDQSVRLEANFDSVFEGTETGEVVFSSFVQAETGSPAPFEVTGTIAVTIQDNNLAPVPTTLASVSVLEGDPAVFSVQFSGASEVPITYPVVLTPIAGQLDDLASPVAFVDLSGVFVLSTIEDAIPEGDETLLVTVGGLAVATLTIVEDDQLGFGIELVGPTDPISEGDRAEFTLTFPGPTPSGVTVDFVTTVDTDVIGLGAAPANPFTDFQPQLAGHIEVPANQLSVPISILTLTDEVLDDGEVFGIELTIGGMVGNRTAVATILDPTPPPVATVGVSITNPETAEGDTIDVVFSVDNFAPGAVITVPYTIEGTGVRAVTPGTDIDSTSDSVVIDTTRPSDDPSEVRITLSAIDDDVFEDTESYRIVIGEPVGAADPEGAAFAEGTIIDNEETPVIGVIQPAATITEGEQINLGFVRTTAGAVERPITVSYSVSAGFGGLDPIDPATDITLDGATVSGATVIGTVVIQPGQSAATAVLAAIDDDTLEPEEQFSAVLSGMQIAGEDYSVTSFVLVDRGVILDNDQPDDPAGDAARVAQLRTGFQLAGGFFDDWAALFDFDPVTWAGRSGSGSDDPGDLPVATDQLGSLVNAPAATETAIASLPAPAADEDTLAGAVQAMTDPNDNGTPNETGEGACDVVFVRNGILGQPIAPAGEVVRFRCERTLADLAAATGTSIDEWNDSTPGVLQELATALDLDATGGLTPDLTVRVIFGVDADGFYLLGASGIILDIDASLSISGNATAPSSDDTPVSGSATTDLQVRLRPGGTELAKLRVADLDDAPAELLSPIVTGTATSTLGFTTPTAAFEWVGNWSVATFDGTVTTTVGVQTLSADLSLTELEGPGGPATVTLDGTFTPDPVDGDSWELVGALDGSGALTLGGFELLTGDFKMTISDADITNGSATLAAVVRPGGRDADPIGVTLDVTFDGDGGWTATGEINGEQLDLAPLLWLADYVITVDLAHAAGTGTVTGGAALTAATAVVFPEDGSTTTPPAGLLTLTDLVGTVSGNGSTSFSAATVDGNIANGAITFKSNDVSIHFGPDFDDEPLLEIGAVEAVFSQIEDTVVSVTGLTVLQDGRVGADTASLSNEIGLFEAVGLGNIVPFDVTDVDLAFTETIPGTSLKSLDAFDVEVTGGFDQAALGDLPFDLQIQLGGEVVTATSPLEDNVFTFSVAVESLSDGVLRPIDLGPIGLGIENVTVSDDIEVSFLASIVGWQNGELQPGATGSITINDGFDDVSSADGTSLIATIAGNVADGGLDLDGDFTFSARRGAMVLTNLELFVGLHLEIDAAGVFRHEITMKSLELESLSVPLGTLATASIGDVELDFNPAPGQALVTIGGTSTSPTAGARLGFGEGLADIEILEELAGWGGTFGGVAICPDASVHLLPTAFFSVTAPFDELFGIPEEMPLRVEEIGIGFDVETSDEGNPCNGPALGESLTDIRLLFSGGITATESWPIEISLDGLEISLARLVGLQPGFPIINLDQISFGVEPTEIAPGVTIGGLLGFGKVVVEGEDVLYLRVLGEVSINDLGVGAEIIITQYGPLLLAVKAPLGIPLGPTGLVLASVSGGLSFGNALEQPAEPEDLLTLDLAANDVETTEEAIIEALEPLFPGGAATWTRPFSLTLTGHITHVAAPAIAGGEVILGINVGFATGDGVKLFGRGDLTAFGIPVASGGILYDFTNPIEPRFDIAFALPGPAAGVLGFVSPFEATFAMRIDTKGVAPAAALALRTFLQRVIDGSVELGSAAFDDALDAMAIRLQDNRFSPLSLMLLDTNGNGTISASEDTVIITRTMLQNRLLAMLPTTVAGAATFLTTSPRLFEAVLSEMFIALDEVAAGGIGGARADLLDLFGNANRTLAAFAQVLSDALADSAATALTVFDPSMRIDGALQPMLLGIPFGQADGAVSLVINRSGVTLGFGASFSQIADRLANLILPFGIGGALRNIFSLGITDSFTLQAQLPVGGLVTSLVTGTVLPDIDPEDTRWAISGNGRFGILGYESVDARMIVVGPDNRRFLEDNVQVLFDGDGNPLDLSSVLIDNTKLPITSRADFERIVQYGGILIGSRLELPGMITDPVTLLAQIGPPPEDASQLQTWARQVAETLTAASSPIRATLFLPSPLSVLDFDYTAGGDDRFDVIAGLTGSDAQAFLDAPFYEGVFDGTLLSLPLGKRYVRADSTGIQIEGRLPFIGATAKITLGQTDLDIGDGLTIPIPTATAEARLNSAEVAALATNLGVPPAFVFDPGVSINARLVSPAFDIESDDPLEVSGGFRLTAQQDLTGLVDNARASYTILAPTPGNPIPDWDMSASVASIGPIAGASISDAEITFRKRGLSVSGRLKGTATLLGITGTIDGVLNPDLTGTFTVTLAAGSIAKPTISGIQFDGTLQIKLSRVSGVLVGSIAFLGSAILPSWLSTASGAATVAAAGCIDTNLNTEFILAVTNLGFGPTEANGLKTVTVGPRANQTLPAPTAACTLPAGAPTRPANAAVVRVRTTAGVAQVFVDGRVTFNRPGASMPLVGVTGFFTSAGTGSLTVDGNLALLGTTLAMGGTLTLNSAGPSADLSLATPVGQPLTLGGWVIGGSLRLAISRTLYRANLTNGTVTIPGAGTLGVSGFVSSAGVGDLTVTMPTGGLRLGPSPSPFFTTGIYRVSFDGTNGFFQANNARLILRNEIPNPDVDFASIGVDLFRVGSNGTLDVDANGFTFTAPGGFTLVVPGFHLRSNASMGAIVLDVEAALMSIPGIADGGTGRPKLATPAFGINTTLDFAITLAAGQLSLGVSQLFGKIVLAGSDGVFSLRIERRSRFSPARLSVGSLGSIVLNNFVIASDGTFSTSANIAQLGPASLSIRGASFSMSKTGPGISTFSASINGGKLFLPMGEPITLVNLEFNATAFFDTPITVPELNLGPFFKSTNAVFRLRQLSTGLLQLTLTSPVSVTAFAGSSSLSMTNLTVESDGTFDGSITGRLALFGTRLSSATFTLSNVGGVIRLRLPASQGVNFNLGFATLTLSGDAFSDGRFNFTGSIGVDFSFALFSVNGSVSVTVANTGVAGAFSGRGCVFPFPCVSASGSMSSTGFVNSGIRVDTNGNGIPDTGFDIDFQIGTGSAADTTRPVMTAPSSITVNADVPPGVTTVRINYVTPTATDAVDGTVPVVCSPPSGTDFAEGATTVTCVASDKAGNTRSRTFTVTVNDTTADAVFNPLG